MRPKSLIVKLFERLIDAGHEIWHDLRLIKLSSRQQEALLYRHLPNAINSVGKRVLSRKIAALSFDNVTHTVVRFSN